MLENSERIFIPRSLQSGICLALPRRAVPSLAAPRQSWPSLALPCRAMPAVPCLALPRLAMPAVPGLALPRLAMPAVPRRTEPCRAVPGLACLACVGWWFSICFAFSVDCPPRRRVIFHSSLNVPHPIPALILLSGLPSPIPT